MTTAVRCSASASGSPPLIDGDLGPEGVNYTNTMVHTWHRSVKNVTINYVLSVQNDINLVNLYFYRITSMNIGLPSITLYRTTATGSTPQPLEYYITGNDDITREDRVQRNVSLRPTLPLSTSFSLQFDFENTDVDWLVLSETEMCRNLPSGLSITK